MNGFQVCEHLTSGNFSHQDTAASCCAAPHLECNRVIRGATLQLE